MLLPSFLSVVKGGNIFGICGIRRFYYERHMAEKYGTKAFICSVQESHKLEKEDASLSYRVSKSSVDK